MELSVAMRNKKQVSLSCDCQQICYDFMSHRVKTADQSSEIYRNKEIHIKRKPHPRRSGYQEIYGDLQSVGHRVKTADNLPKFTGIKNIPHKKETSLKVDLDHK
ncbi:hypothetical protein KIN20_001866 [Parelaphostrongylus tenuis]|uniref:Uncharacterized protein n=1 Tax=Parelaphostrongylus tenuis TaxID=148309 RepID=A0AAD5LZ03_PARTN|nr:hypothetical protein KIN20_001866 [Parelaphostrongylus tenuis]